MAFAAFGFGSTFNEGSVYGSFLFLCRPGAGGIRSSSSEIVAMACVWLGKFGSGARLVGLGWKSVTGIGLTSPLYLCCVTGFDGLRPRDAWDSFACCY